MRAGKVVQVRVNPRDCMSVIDICKLTGLAYQKDMSFPAMVSLALSALMQTARKQGIIPDRDGFEYLEMMAPYETGRSGRKLEITKTIHQAGSRLDISLPEEYANVNSRLAEIKDAGVTHEARDPHAGKSVEWKEAWRELQDANVKRTAFESDRVNFSWTTADEDRFHELVAFVWPNAGSIPRIV